jgi:signal transduction histidine kinase/PAS domain-containing protein
MGVDSGNAAGAGAPDLSSAAAVKLWLSALFARETDALRLLAAVEATIGRFLNVSRVAYGEIDAALTEMTVALDWTAGGVASATGRRPFDPDNTFARLYRSGRTLVVSDSEAEPAIADQRDWMRANQVRAIIGVPLIDDGRLVAVFNATHDRPRAWSEEEVVLVAQIGARLWSALQHLRTLGRLRESEDQFRALAENMPGLAWLAGPDGRAVWGNRRWADFFAGTDGIDDARAAIHPDDHARTVQAWEEARATGTATELTVRLRGADGLYHPFLSRSAPIRGADGQVVRWCGVLVDVAPQQAQTRRQAALRAFADATRDLDAPAAIVGQLGELMIRQLGLDRLAYFEAGEREQTCFDTFEVRPGRGLVATGRAVRVDEGDVLLDRYRQGATLVVDDREADAGLDPAARARWRGTGAAAAIVVPIVKEGRLLAVVSATAEAPRRWSRDDVELVEELAERGWTAIARARAEAALLERERHQRFLIAWGDRARAETTPEAILGGTLEMLGRYLGVTRCTYAEADAALVHFEVVEEWRDGVGSIKGNRFALASVGSAVDRAWTAGEPVVYADTQGDDRLEPAARERYAAREIGAFVSVPLVLDGALRSALSVQHAHPRRWSAEEVQLIRDVGERTWLTLERARAEAALARSREALYQTEKLSALGSLLAGVSHELNNPLSIVVAQSVMMERQARGTDIEVRAQKIRAAADRCARIVQVFLAMARQKRPKREPAEVNAIVQAARELTDYGLRTAGITVRAELAPDLPPISADADQLHQVLVNLIVNAQQAMVEAGSDPRVLTLATAPGDAPGTVAVEVADTGPGIPEEASRRVFEPFYTTKPQGEGTGVGLSFSQGVAEAHGGRLELVRGAGTGARFRLTLPIDAGDALAPVEAPGDQAPAGPARRALLVDDEEEIAESLADFLQYEGFACDIATDGGQAKARLAGGAYDLVVSDLRMPGIDGPQLHAWVAATRPDLVERMAFATGDTLGAHAARFLAEVRRPVLEKPFMPDAVRRLLVELELV